jgi:hypothetical protein
MRRVVTVFACYGPLNAGENASPAATRQAVAKVASDFQGAVKNWAYLKRWVFVTNYLAIPSPILREILRIQATEPNRQLSTFGKERFAETILRLSPADIEELLGAGAFGPLQEVDHAFLARPFERVIDAHRRAVAKRSSAHDWWTNPIPIRVTSENSGDALARDALEDWLLSSSPSSSLIRLDGTERRS